MSDFLDKIPLSTPERVKLLAFGAATPLALLSLRKASKEAFDNYIGLGRADEIVKGLEKLITDAERTTLSQPLQRGGALGARIDTEP